ncbi:MAG: hypothetical protein WAM82_23740 [Thermoanaerobaculia bacterium]
MSSANTALDEAIAQCDRLRTLLKKKKSSAQVRSFDERAVLKATALAWFNNQRPLVISTLEAAAIISADATYKILLTAGDRAISRTKLLENLKRLRMSLIALRSEAVSAEPGRLTTDSAPSFAPLIADKQMQDILASRWAECVKCLTVDAPLAATVMMGGLVEALLLARINRESNKSSIFTGKTAPRDKSGQTKPLNDWTLKNYIEVVREQGWITVSAKDVSEVLRDYRNFVHPFKQLSHNVHLTATDAKLLWEITKNISRQVLEST